MITSGKVNITWEIWTKLPENILNTTKKMLILKKVSKSGMNEFLILFLKKLYSLGHYISFLNTSNLRWHFPFGITKCSLYPQYYCVIDANNKIIVDYYNL
jgi:hypothetical protein